MVGFVVVFVIMVFTVVVVHPATLGFIKGWLVVVIVIIVVDVAIVVFVVLGCSLYFCCS